TVPAVSANGLPYTTFTFNQSRGGIIPTQDAYLPLSIQYQLGNLALNNPSDITIDSEDNIYIADYIATSTSSAGYIIKYNLEDNTVVKIGEGILEQPTGV